MPRPPRSLERAACGTARRTPDTCLPGTLCAGPRPALGAERGSEGPRPWSEELAHSWKEPFPLASFLPFLGLRTPPVRLHPPTYNPVGLNRSCCFLTPQTGSLLGRPKQLPGPVGLRAAPLTPAPPWAPPGTEQFVRECSSLGLPSSPISGAGVPSRRPGSSGRPSCALHVTKEGGAPSRSQREALGGRTWRDLREPGRGAGSSDPRVAPRRLTGTPVVKRASFLIRKQYCLMILAFIYVKIVFF